MYCSYPIVGPGRLKSFLTCLYFIFLMVSLSSNVRFWSWCKSVTTCPQNLYFWNKLLFKRYSTNTYIFFWHPKSYFESLAPKNIDNIDTLMLRNVKKKKIVNGFQKKGCFVFPKEKRVEDFTIKFCWEYKYLYARSSSDFMAFGWLLRWHLLNSIWFFFGFSSFHLSVILW